MAITSDGLIDSRGSRSKQLTIRTSVDSIPGNTAFIGSRFSFPNDQRIDRRNSGSGVRGANGP